jgi:hypothetical protein
VRRGTILKKENIAECERNLNINDLLHPYQIPEVVYDATTTSELQKGMNVALPHFFLHRHSSSSATGTRRTPGFTLFPANTRSNELDSIT